MALDPATLESSWKTHPRWAGITRPYSAADVERLRGTLHIEYTLAKTGAEKLWKLLHAEPTVKALGAMTGNQAVEQVSAGLPSVYASGWQVAADANNAGQIYPDQGLYPADSVPRLVRTINNALQRADQIDHADGKAGTDWYAPIVADAESGFGGTLNAFELMKSMIEAGAAGVHFEDQISSVKKFGAMGGKAVGPTSELINKLIAARLAADIMDVPTILIARTDSHGAKLIRSDSDERDKPFITGERTADGDFLFRGGIEPAITRCLAAAPYADMLWCETMKPDLEEARRFADAIHAKFPGKLLAIDCASPLSLKKVIGEANMDRFHSELAAMGFKYQFITLAGFHSLNMSMFDLSLGFLNTGVKTYADLQERGTKASKEHGYRAAKQARFTGAGYFDDIAQVIAAGKSAPPAKDGPTE
ncbi:MAG: isocitrate lyase [Candidatus Acidiferrales bacterium]